MGTKGLWIGPLAACAYLTIGYNILIACLDWDELFKEIQERRDQENEMREQLSKNDDFMRAKIEDDRKD